MRRHRTPSVKAKLILASVLGSGTALLMVGAVITTYDFITLRRTLVRRMSVQADIVGANCQSALLFSDPKSAEATLGALKADLRILAAGLYTADRRLFATYVGDPSGGASLLAERLPETDDGHILKSDRLLLFRSVTFERKPIGTVVIVSDLRDISASLTRDILSCATSMAASA